MNTLTAQELALYPNQEVKSPEGLGKISRISFENEVVTLLFGIMGPDYEHKFALPDARLKLLLRPLSDITEEEFTGLKKVLGHPNENATLRKATPTSIEYEYTKSKQYKGLKGTIDINKISPSAVDYLRSIGICLNPEWFEQGKAIAKPRNRDSSGSS